MNFNPKKLWKKISSGLPKTQELLWLLGVHAFAIVLFFIFLEIFFGAALFYKYVYLVGKESPKIDESSFRFDNASYRQVLNEWQAREQKLQEFFQKDYPTPF